MSDELVIVPSNGDGYVELARTKQGRLFRKHILNKGDLRHPTTGKTIKVDETFVKTLKTNFEKGYCDIVQVPLANDNNEHTEAPERNIGEVIGIEDTDDKVYAILDIRDADKADKLGKTLLGASAMMHLDYTDTKTGNKVGPTLLHSCVTNRPYVTGLQDYEEIVAATSDTSQGAVLLSAEDVVEVESPTEEKDEMGDEPTRDTAPKLTKDELFSILQSEHGIDVSALQTKADEGTQATQLSQALVKALTDAGVVKLSNTDTGAAATEAVSTEDVVGAVAELAQNNVTLTDKVNKLELRDAEHAVDTLVTEGRVLPAQKDAFVKLKLSDAKMFDALVPAQAIVKLTTENGVTPPNDDKHVKDIDAEVARLSALLS